MLSLNSISYWDLLSYPSWSLFWGCTLPRDMHTKIVALVSLGFGIPFHLMRQALLVWGSMVENKAMPSAPKRRCLV